MSRKAPPTAPAKPASVPSENRHPNTVAGLAANPAPASPVVVPKEYESHDPALKHPQLAFAIELGTKYPGIVSAAIQFRESMGQAELALGVASDRYRGVASELRTAKLNGREASLLLRGLGFASNRVHELQKVAALPDEQWSKYVEGKIGFKAAFALRNGEPAPAPAPAPAPVPAVGDPDADEADEVTAGGNAPAKTVIRDLPFNQKGLIMGVLRDWETPLHDGKQTVYGLGLRINGVSFYVTLTATPIPQP